MSDNNKNFEREVNAADNAASVNNVNETKMKISTVEALQAERKQIVFLAFNRDVTDKTPHVRRLAKSIKEVGLLTPLLLVPAPIALEEGVELLDSKGSKVTEGENKLVLADGNNKFKAIHVLRKSGDSGKAAEPINCIIDEDAKNIQEMVMIMNNEGKPWSYADAIKAEEKALAERRQAKERKAESIKAECRILVDEYDGKTGVALYQL